jgi:hypothetical protein
MVVCPGMNKPQDNRRRPKRDLQPPEVAGAFFTDVGFGGADGITALSLGVADCSFARAVIHDNITITGEE